MTRWIKISATLLLAASAARAQSFTAFDSVFDGRSGPKGFAPGSVLPVLRDGKGPEAPVIGSLRPVLGDLPSVPATVELVPVALEVVVPATNHQPQAVAERLVRLSNGYRFSADPAFDPIRLVEFHILPFPPITPPQNTYLVRGVVPATRLEEIKRDNAVRQIYQDRSADSKGLEEIVLRHGKAIRRTPGVREVYVGFDCGLREPHQHIRPHVPAIVVVAEGSKTMSVRNEIFQSVPALAIEPIVFVNQ